MYRKLYRQGFAAYAVMFVLALMFYKERTVFVDIALHLFAILVNNDFTIQNFRYGAAVTQVFPLMAGRLSLPLDIIMMIYSGCFVVYYALCYTICGGVLKNYKVALALLLSQTLFAAHSFYWIQSELPQGMAFMMVLFACLNNLEERRLTVSAAVLLIILLTATNFFHPTLVIPALFVFAFMYLNNANAKRLIVVSAVAFVVIYVLKRFIFVNAYDHQALGHLRNFKTLFPDYFFIASNGKFLRLCLNTYYWIPLSFVAIVWIYVYRRNWQKLLLFIGAFFGYLFLVNVSYPNGMETEFYMENLYLPLSVILAFPFVFDLMPVLEKKNLVAATVWAIILTGCVRMYLTHDIYTRRLNWERNFLRANMDKKLLVYPDKVPMDILLMIWSTPFEFWLLSTSEQGKTASIIISERPPEHEAAVGSTKSLITTWGVYQYQELPEKYFNLTDTVTSYTVIK